MEEPKSCSLLDIRQRNTERSGALSLSMGLVVDLKDIRVTAVLSLLSQSLGQEDRTQGI